MSKTKRLLKLEKELSVIYGTVICVRVDGEIRGDTLEQETSFFFLVRNNDFEVGPNARIIAPKVNRSAYDAATCILNVAVQFGPIKSPAEYFETLSTTVVSAY